jgi:hypothetical protein
MQSRVADQARLEGQLQVRSMTPQQRLQAFQQHCELVVALQHAGKLARPKSGCRPP